MKTETQNRMTPPPPKPVAVAKDDGVKLEMMRLRNAINSANATGLMILGAVFFFFCEDHGDGPNFGILFGIAVFFFACIAKLMAVVMAFDLVKWKKD